jgi:hypothetical protein
MGKAFKILPKNYLADWGEFESWSQGTGSAPDGWISASNPTFADQEATNFKYGKYGVRIVGGAAGTAIAGIYRTVPNGSSYQGRTFSLGFWAKSTSTGPYIELNDGVASKTIHLNGSNAMSFYTTPVIKIDYTATQMRVNLFCNTGATAYFDGGVLCEGEDLFTNFDTNIDISDWQPSLSMKQDQYEISQREGSFIPDNHIQGKTIKLSGSVVGTDVVSTRTNFDNLLKSLLAWQTAEKRNLYLYDDRVAEVFFKGFDWKYQNGLQMIRFNLNFSLPDGTTRYLGKFRNRKVISGTITEFNLSYNGNAKALPIVSFVADQGATISTCVFENLTTGENFAYTGTVPSGGALDIDCDLGTVQNSSADSLGNWSGIFLGIVRGTNNLRFSGQNCTINIDYYERNL